jgi:hypothetical protein
MNLLAHAALLIAAVAHPQHHDKPRHHLGPVRVEPNASAYCPGSSGTTMADGAFGLLRCHRFGVSADAHADPHHPADLRAPLLACPGSRRVGDADGLLAALLRPGIGCSAGGPCGSRWLKLCGSSFGLHFDVIACLKRTSCSRRVITRGRTRRSTTSAPIVAPTDSLRPGLPSRP